MTSTFTTHKKIEQPAHNDYVNSWDVPVNADWSIIDTALGGTRTINLTGLSGGINLAAADYQPLKITVTGTPIGNVFLLLPGGVGGMWVVRNNTSGAFPINFGSFAGGPGVVIPVNSHVLVTCDGVPGAGGTVPAVVFPTAPGAAGANTQIQFNNIGNFGASSDLTWDNTTGLLTTLNLLVKGGTTFGDNIADQISIVAGKITTPGVLTFNTDQLIISDPTSGSRGIGIGVAPGTDKLRVAGTINSTSGGYLFPDGTLQTTAVKTGVAMSVTHSSAFPAAPGVPVLGCSTGSIGAAGQTQTWLITGGFFVNQHATALSFWGLAIVTDPATTTLASAIISTTSNVNTCATLRGIATVTAPTIFRLSASNDVGAGELNGDSWISAERLT